MSSPRAMSASAALASRSRARPIRIGSTSSSMTSPAPASPASATPSSPIATELLPEEITSQPVTFQVGNQYEPFSLETLNSSKHITFIERAMTEALTPARHIGASIGVGDKQWSVKSGIFSTSPQDNAVVAAGRRIAILGRRDPRHLCADQGGGRAAPFRRLVPLSRAEQHDGRQRPRISCVPASRPATSSAFSAAAAR